MFVNCINALIIIFSGSDNVVKDMTCWQLSGAVFHLLWITEYLGTKIGVMLFYK